MSKGKKPRKYTSDTYFKARVGKFILGRVDYMETVAEIDFSRLADVGVNKATSYSEQVCTPPGCDDLAGQEFVFEILSWRERRHIEGAGFCAKYSMRAMWYCGEVYQQMQKPDKGKPTLWLRKEHCIVLRELDHAAALELSAAISRPRLAALNPRRMLAL